MSKKIKGSEGVSLLARVFRYFNTLTRRFFFFVLCLLLLSADKEKKPEKKLPGKIPVIPMGKVSVKKTAPSVIRESTTRTVIPQKKIEDHSHETLDDALKSVSGLIVLPHTKGSTRLFMRGFGQDKIAIEIDGVLYTDSYATEIDLSDFNIKDARQIEVFSGVASALMGAYGPVGLIRIYSFKPESFILKGRVEYGILNNFKGSFLIGDKKKGYYYSFALNASTSQGYYVSSALNKNKRIEYFNEILRPSLYGVNFNDIAIPAKNDYINNIGLWPHTSYIKSGTAIVYGYNPKKSFDIGVRVHYSFKTKKQNTFQVNSYSDYKGDSNFWYDPFFILTDPANIKKVALRNRSFVYPQIHNALINPYIEFKYKKFHLRANLFVTHKSSQQEGYADNAHTYVKDAALADTTYEPYYDWKHNTAAGFNILPSIKLTKNNKLSAALRFTFHNYIGQEQAVNATVSPYIASTIFGTDAFTVRQLQDILLTIAVEDEWKITKHFRVTAGISYDMQFLLTFKSREALYQFTDSYIVQMDSSILGTKDSFNPVLALAWDIVPKHLTYVFAFSMKSRFPTLSEYSRIVDERYDEGLKPEHSYNGNTGLKFKFFKDNLVFRCDYFISAVKDRIMKLSGGMAPPVNLDFVLGQGTEISLKFKWQSPKKKWLITGDLSYTYLWMRNYDTSSDEKANRGPYIEYVPEHTLVFSLKVFWNKQMSLNFWGTFNAGQKIYVMSSAPPSAPTTVSQYSNEYFEVKYLHNPLKFHVKLAFHHKKKYQYWLMFKNILDDYNANPFNPGPGRMIYGGISFKLK